MQNIHFRRREGWVLLNWRDHSWLHLFRRDKVVCSNITMSAEGGGRSLGEWGIKERGIRARKGRNNGEKEAVRVNKNNSIQNKREPQREKRTRTKWEKKKYSSLWRCTVGIAVWAHFALILHLFTSWIKTIGVSSPPELQSMWYMSGLSPRTWQLCRIRHRQMIQGWIFLRLWL